MESYQVTATVNELGSLTIPAPVSKTGARLRLVVNWEEETLKSYSASNRTEALRKFRGCLKNSSILSSNEWNAQKHEIWG